MSPTPRKRDPNEQQGPVYSTHDGPEVRALQFEKNAARSRWRMTHVALDTSTRRAASNFDAAPALEAHAEHLAALREWKAAEARFIAARLGFSREPLPPR